MVKELFNGETFTFNEWCKIYLYNDWLNLCFPEMKINQKYDLLKSKAIDNKVNLFRP
jgi:hypothetical protein